ncbi:aryl-alcohol dehydrogenase-like predicted oxidoreductase [Haloferula luteola]|uniref:Aryl-alcohol dehydrogenase-like predicted oxidoreductase n=1 Tax=Haloferula luteola TaxID=595692 RepID=A0A840VH03_9BACT|nr:aldo/keto reductase [Haloferula luteola]MBB5353099.1 aryl-alcohol dehydrogenase-like predicted oxidoreductase [Haloferula luteola]
MDLTTTAYGTWSGGRFMHFGETLSEDRYKECIQIAYEAGFRTFVTADVYGNGKADELLGEALEGVDRSSYCLVGTLGHDFYEGQRQGNRGYPRFTDPELRGEDGYAGYLKMACEKSLERCKTDHFDMLMLHNPDEAGYTSEAVWGGLENLRSLELTRQLGIAPGPANGFTLDLIHALEKFGDSIDWAMLILNPLEPWPVGLALPACEKFDVKVLTRVVDFGGLFFGDMQAGHAFKPGDHRAYRPDGWVEHGLEKIEKMKPIAERHGLSMVQFAAIWNLSQSPVRSVVPTFIQEAGEQARPIEARIREFAVMPEVRLSAEEIEEVKAIGDNTGCMTLKGASKRHAISERPDEWPMREDLLELAGRYELGTEW